MRVKKNSNSGEPYLEVERGDMLDEVLRVLHETDQFTSFRATTTSTVYWVMLPGNDKPDLMTEVGIRQYFDN